MSDFAMNIGHMSLRYKVTGLFALLFAAISASLYLYLPYRFQSQALSIMRHSAEASTAAVCYGLAPALYFEDAHAIDQMLSSVMLNENVVDVDVFDAEGKLVGEASRDGWNHDDMNQIAAPDGVEMSEHFVRLTKQVIYEGVVLGQASVRFHLNSVNREVAESKKAIAFLCILIFGFGMLLMLAVGRLLTARLWKISRVTDAVAQGDLTQRVDETTLDEIGKLAQVFNNMLVSIQDANTKLSAHARELDFELGERRRAEQEILRIRDLLRDVIDSMPSPLVAVNANGRITIWNQMAAEYADLEDTRMNRAFAWDALPVLRDKADIVLRALQTEKVERCERLSIQGEGAQRFIDVVVYPLHGAAHGAVIRLDDVTEEVRMLELMAQTEKMMSVGGLAAGMAHEINNPLGIIVQSAQNIQRRIDPGLSRNEQAARESGVSVEGISSYLRKREVPELIRDIQDASRRAATIVTNMLNFSRHSSSGLIATSIPNLLRNAVELAANDYDLRKRYDFRNIDVQFQIDESLPPVPCVESKIEQVILNLLKNAAQAIGEHGSNGPPRIICRAGRESKFVCIEIEDNGPGMSDDVRRRVFEPFFTTKEVGTGTGLGLSVSYFIIHENHGGTLTVDSSLGNGTKFTIRLPLVHETRDMTGVRS